MENFSTNFDAYNKLALAKTNDTYSANIQILMHIINLH